MIMLTILTIVRFHSHIHMPSLLSFKYVLVIKCQLHHNKVVLTNWDTKRTLLIGSLQRLDEVNWMLLHTELCFPKIHIMKP